jgi:hypothetical protein
VLSQALALAANERFAHAAAMRAALNAARSNVFTILLMIWQRYSILG